MIDCLTLNVYQCTAMQDRFLPVLVYVHEGEPEWDSTANFDPNQVISNLACKGMIVVTVHYRQSIFGSFNFIRPSSAVSDIQLALEWVNKTIETFNGDPKQVTLMGSRRGAQIASYLSRLPKTKDLFSQMILIGGAADDPAIFPGNRDFLYEHIFNVARRANCTSAGDDPSSMNKRELTEVINCMRKFRKPMFLRADQKMRMFWNRWPIDTSGLEDEPGSLTSMNVMLGSCRNAPEKSSSPVDKDRLKKNLLKVGDFKRTHDLNAFVDHYYSRYENSSLKVQQIMRLVRNDFLETGPLLSEAHRLSSQPNSNVYMFSLQTENDRYKYDQEISPAPSEIFAPCLEHLLFRKPPANDTVLQKFMADSVSNFVINGNPNKPNSTDLKWAEFNATTTLNTYNVLNLNSQGIEVIENWETSSAKFWLCEHDKARNVTASAYCS